MSNTKCSCKNPEAGGTKCPSQHIAICFRGKDRECYGECIPIANEYRTISDDFSMWAKNTIKDKIIEHLKDFPNEYKAYGSKEDLTSRLKTEYKIDRMNFSGLLICYISDNYKIPVKFSFSFNDDINPNNRQMLTY